MNNCGGYQIRGFIRKVQSLNSKQLVLELQPNSELMDELCGFCNVINPQEADQETEKQLKEVRGSFVVKQENNQLIFTLENSKKDNVCRDKKDEMINKAAEQSSKPAANVLQYEVDGKVYALKSTHSKKKTRSQNRQQDEKQSIDAKPTEFLIEDKAYSIAKINTKPFEEAYKISDDEQRAMQRSLELLQVKLMDKCLIPDTIVCGPDTATFLNNMKELAKLAGSNQSSFKCVQCNDELSSYFPYVEHIFKHFATRPYVCAVCQASFQTRAVMRHHLDMHGGKTPFQCEFCGKKFRNSCHMKQHRMRHTGERPHPCPYCDKTFAHKNVLKIHLQSHTGQKPCQCDLCGKLFREPHRLACHLATHYRPSKSLECQTCGKTFKTNGMLKLHTEKRCKGQRTNEKPLENNDYAQHDQMEDEHHQQVTIIEAETLEDGTMVLPVNTYLVEPSSGTTMLVEFAINSSEEETQSQPTQQGSSS